MSQNLNEIAAMALVGEFVSVKELLTAAMKGFAEDEDIKSQENDELYHEAWQVFSKIIKRDRMVALQYIAEIDKMIEEDYQI